MYRHKFIWLQQRVVGFNGKKYGDIKRAKEKVRSISVKRLDTVFRHSLLLYRGKLYLTQ